ncbi:hypothetical protein DER45DRAFT_588427 [Fusarium avenaceum]|nr:hypothetical protein DER45DRAFT_588427 [Fusarium avenaceum]
MSPLTIPVFSTAVAQAVLDDPPRSRVKLSETLGQALPELDYDDVSILNPGIDILYHADMALVPLASWSGGCSKMLELDGAKSTKTLIVHRPTSAPTGATSGGGLIPRARSVGTSDGSRSVETPGTTGMRTNPHAATGTATSMLYSEFKIEFARSFYDRLQNIAVDAAHPIKLLPYGDTLIGMQVLPSCPKHAIGAKNLDVCRRVLKNINYKYPKAGGIYSNYCVLYYFFKR